MTIRLFAAAALVAAHGFASASAGAAEFIEGTDRTKARAYSPAVITDGGRIVWLAGMGGITDADGSRSRILLARPGERSRILMRRLKGLAGR
jgi:hypothetical protein